MAHSPAQPRRFRLELWVIVLACFLPTLVTLVYFAGAEEGASGVAQAAYLGGKLIQFSLPAVWLWGVLGRRDRLAWPGAQWLWWGIGFGCLVGAAIGGLYVSLEGTALLSSASQAVSEKMRALGVADPLRFTALAVFYSMIHSLLEEYYWRWFVHGQLRARFSGLTSTFFSSLSFALHHVVVLMSFFQDAPWAAGLLSLAVAIGGVIWAWMYDRSGSILPGWLSHMLVDAAIFAVGYRMALA